MIDGIAAAGAALLLLLLVVVPVMMYRLEKREAKEGHCGLPWMSFDMASDGSIGTKCQKCGTYGPWFSWYKKDICTRNWATGEKR